MTKADELWKKYADFERMQNVYMTKVEFESALQEYGELVKAEAVKVCLHNSPRPFTTAGIIERSQCTHAIKEMKLP
jgi:hypothetical protein